MVLVCHPNQFVFLKTFKTASTSVEDYLEQFCLPPGAKEASVKTRAEIVSEYGIVGGRGGAAVDAAPEWPGQMKAEEVRDKLGAEKSDSYTKLITIRNPFPRLVSAFQVKGLDSGEAIELPFEEQAPRFREWLLRAGPSLADLDRYIIDGKPIADMAIRMEHLHEDMDSFSKKVGLPTYDPEQRGHFRAAKNRKKARAAYEEFYDEKTEAFVRQHFAWELETYGYDMGQVDPHFPSLKDAQERAARKAKRAAKAERRAAKAAAEDSGAEG